MTESGTASGTESGAESRKKEGVRVALIGAGRIGRVHAQNLARHPRVVFRGLAETDPEVGASLCRRYGVSLGTPEAFWADPEVQAVLICSPTATHAAYIEQAARAGKVIFCEKPIDLALERVQACLQLVRQTRASLVLGFNRRFDRHFAAARAQLAAGAVGDLAMMTIASRDPDLPSLDYLRQSGGLFRDMMIHDFDMARFMLGALTPPDTIASVFASGSCLVDPAVGAIGDIDTAIVQFRTRQGRLGVITNSRRAPYGYDQRLELHGREGMLAVDNVAETKVQYATRSGFLSPPLERFFLERYEQAYQAELAHFIDVVAGDADPSPDGEDGLAALQLAEAAETSLETGRPVSVPVAVSV